MMGDWRDRPCAPYAPGIASDILFAVDGLIVAVITLDPGAAVPVHQHDHQDEVFDILEGVGEIWIDGWQPFTVGQTAIAPAGTLHALRNPGTRPLVIRETVRQRVYARGAIRSALAKRWARWRGR